MQGRKIIPIDVKKAKGTYQACRDKGQPEVSAQKPIPPKALSEREKQIFNILTERLGSRATASYTEVQTMCAQRLCEVEECDKTIENEGATYKTSNSFGDAIIKEHPASKLREKALRHAQSLLAAMGLTHVDGLKFGTGKSTEKKNEFEGF
ncbi:MAG: P27 family phage terminase small subunit [Deltaproteobacteria bacterium]|nr:P27 family phage terminase small subunit [Deltaproteobacteria bacterium]